MSNVLTPHQIVQRVIGPIHSTADSYIDSDRLTNLQHMTELVDRLIFDINQVANDADRPEASVKALGKHAKEFLENLKLELP